MMFLLFISAAYLLVMLAIFMGNVSSSSLKDCSGQAHVSILIPFRNEQEHLKSLVESLNLLNYPKEKIQLIFVNDHSNDEGLKLLERELKEKNMNYDLVELLDTFGKKAGLTAGLALAKHPYIFHLDADCSVNPDWIITLLKGFEKEEVKLVLGPIQYFSSKGLLGQFASAELAYLMAITAGTSSLGIPVLANGANLAYKKEVFDAINPFSGNNEIASGDDMFLLHAVKKNYGATAIQFLNEKSAIVETSTPKGLKSMLYQKLRWAEKGRYYTDIQTIIVGSLIVLMNLCLFVVYGMYFMQVLPIQFVIGLVLFKFSIDFLMVQSIRSLLNKGSNMILQFLLTILFPFYSLLVGILSLFMRPIWKDRQL